MIKFKNCKGDIVMKKIFFSTLLVSSYLFCMSTNKIYDIKGMMCDVGCVDRISSILKNLDGVEEFSVDFENTTVEILFDDENLTSEKVINIMPDPYKMMLIKETVSKQYAVSGITCMGCIHNIKNSLNDTEGLETYNLDFDESLLYIEYDFNKTNDKEILNRIPEKFKLVEIISSNDVEEVEDVKSN